MTRCFALLIGVSMLASACSSQDTNTVDAASPDYQHSAGPDGAVETPVGNADVTNVGETEAGTNDIAANATPETGKRIVDCKIISGGREVLDAPCEFSPQSNGGFTLMSEMGESAIYDRILSVSVSKIGNTTAEVRGMTPDGINSRWGQASRSKQDPACWTGSDFSVCAY